MLRLLMVCTGNVCRSPLAELVLAYRLEGLGVHVSSAGTRPRPGMRMTTETASIAVENGVAPHRVMMHSARQLSVSDLQQVDLVLAMARDHRREVVELRPGAIRQTFTVRELSRLMSGMSDKQLLATQVSGDEATKPSSRLGQMLVAVAGQRGTSLPPSEPDVDDVVDPYGRSERTYSRSAEQLLSALPAVERLVRLSLS